MTWIWDPKMSFVNSRKSLKSLLLNWKTPMKLTRWDLSTDLQRRRIEHRRKLVNSKKSLIRDWGMNSNNTKKTSRCSKKSLGRMKEEIPILSINLIMIMPLWAKRLRLLRLTSRKRKTDFQRNKTWQHPKLKLNLKDSTMKEKNCLLR